jgi:hypothetical protein
MILLTGIGAWGNVGQDASTANVIASTPQDCMSVIQNYRGLVKLAEGQVAGL